MAQVVETDHIERCPFCGGNAEIKTDKYPMNDAYNYCKVFCPECGASGRMFLDGETVGFKGIPSRFVTGEEARENAIAEWNKRAGLQVDDIMDDLLEICVQTERAVTVMDELRQDYFAESYEGIKEHSSSLLFYYDRARIFAEVAHDYAWEASQLASALNDKICDKRGKDNENC